MSGSIIIVGTPIGNVGDLSTRAASVLAAADVIVCEDTRRSGKLFELCGIVRRGRFVVLNDHADERRIAGLVDEAVGGASVAVVSDAGMPGISDPGERLVAAAIDAGVRIEVVPGPSAAVTALVASGFPAGRYCFEGFLPRKGVARAARLEAVLGDTRTSVLYESPHRVAATLADLDRAGGTARRVVVGRELTKLHEEFWRGTVAEAARHFTDEPPRGEVTIVIEGSSAAAPVDDDELRAALRAHVSGGLSTRDAVDAVVAEFGSPRKAVYRLALDL